MANIKDLPKPNWDLLQDGWLAHIPLSLVGHSANVETLLKLANIDPDDKVELDLVPGIRERTLSDVLVLRQKGLNCFEASQQLLNGGYSTLTALTMYDASFFCAKALIYLLGIRDTGRSSKSYLSLFYSYKIKRIVYDGHYSVKLAERLTHDSLWNIFVRAINTIGGSTPVINLVKTLRNNDYASFSRERNHLAYEAVGWSRSADPVSSDLFNSLSYVDNHSYFKSLGMVEAEYVDKYYRTAHTLLGIIDGLLLTIGNFAPAITNHLTAYPGPPSVKSVSFS
jgi:uncharacterized protein (UPF0332 family)